MRQCWKTLKELLYTKMCGTMIVREDVSKRAEKFKPDNIRDCVVSWWKAGKCVRKGKLHKCDKKVKGDPDAGTSILTRTVVQQNNTYGTQCPKLSWRMPCNGFLCPIHCRMSAWSAWGKCTKDCGSGTKFATRRVLVKPRNGGRPCGGVVAKTPCNTRSCDRNCRLHKFLPWTACSQACKPSGGGAGFKETFRRIRLPARGRGICWKKHNWRRYRKKRCNTQKCVGDERCIAKLDMVIALDGSGSVKKSGWSMLTNFTGELVEKFVPKFARRYRMKLGLVQFGNGKIMKTAKGQSYVAEAREILPLSFKCKRLKNTITGLKKFCPGNVFKGKGKAKKCKVKKEKLDWQGGFTNMAQGFQAAKNMFLNGGRKRSHSKVLMISDCKPSFKYNTKKSADDLKDQGTVIHMVCVQPSKVDTVEPEVKKWASKPTAANYDFVPGFKAIQQNVKKWVSKTLVSSCPMAWSKSYQKKVNKARGFTLWRWRRDCLDWWWRLHRSCKNGKCYGRSDCTAAANKLGAKYFVIYTIRWGRYSGRSFCYAHKKNDGICRFKRIFSFKWWGRTYKWVRRWMSCGWNSKKCKVKTNKKTGRKYSKCPSWRRRWWHRACEGWTYSGYSAYRIITKPAAPTFTSCANMLLADVKANSTAP